jgi:uncharacterized protein YegL
MSELDAMEFLDQQPRCPCVLLLDTSGSMSGPAIDALNMGLQTFRTDLGKDELASKRVEVAVVEFNSSVNVVQDFIQAKEFNPPTLSTTGSTAMGSGLLKALELVKERRKKYKTNGVTAFKPWIFMITDGGPTDSVVEATTKIQEGEKNGDFVCFAVGVQGADMNALRQIVVREPKLLDGLNFGELFEWLSDSLKSVSNSSPGDMVPMADTGWAKV